MDVTPKIINANIHFPVPIGTGSNAPRLYYKINSSNFVSVNAFEIIGENYKFQIPGQQTGTQVSYYIAAQGSAGTIIATLPSGGNGINPPGSTPPVNPFVYYIWSGLTRNSVTVPKPIPDLTQIKDSIYIPQTGLVEDIVVTINITIRMREKIVVFLNKSPSSATLSQYNGLGGANYFNTIFDDRASLGIKQGTLNDWSLDILYSSTVSLKKKRKLFLPIIHCFRIIRIRLIRLQI